MIPQMLRTMTSHVLDSLLQETKMAAIMQDNRVEEEYLWSCTLSGSAKEYTWAPDDPADVADDDEKDPSVKPGHRLLIKSAILMPSAKTDEVTIVQIESEGYNKRKVIVPFCAMKGGSDLQKYIDLLVPDKAKITLLQGEGPINLVGSHCVDFFGYRDVDADSEEEDEPAEEDAEMEEVKDKGDKKTPSKDGSDKKRKASGDAEAPKSAEKKKKGSPAK